jgi:septum formation protein
MTRLILGSQSPRRKEILSYFSLPFEQISSAFDEESIVFQGDPIAYVLELSKGKAHSLLEKIPEGIILTADTVVWQNGNIYNKPKSPEEASEFLREFSGTWHSVFTGITLAFGARELQAYEETKVLFNPLTPNQIDQYIATHHWKDKAGGYAIQQAGGLFVERIEGCYYNVMGFPINSVRKLLAEIGIDLWAFLK